MNKILKISLIIVGILFVLMILFPGEESGDFAETKEEISKNPEQRNKRIIAIDITDSYNNDNYADHVALAKSIGAEQIGLFLIWDWLEPDKGEYDSQILDIASSYYPTVDIKIDLTLAPIETITTRFPKDLQGKAINDLEIIQRFKKFIDFVIEKSKFEISSINIGSEFDILFNEDDEEWEQYIEFYKEIYSYLKSKNLDFPITTEATHTAYTNQKQLKYMRTLSDNMDVIAISYYPMKDNGNVEDPKIVHEDFKYLTGLFPDKKIWFYQYGYPSSKLLDSSEEKQAEFIRKTFNAWDTHKDQIEMIDFTWMHDLSEESSRDTGERYGSTEKKFIEFLGTLGLRTYQEDDKLALKALKEEAEARGW